MNVVFECAASLLIRLIFSPETGQDQVGRPHLWRVYVATPAGLSVKRGSLITVQPGKISVTVSHWLVPFTHTVGSLYKAVGCLGAWCIYLCYSHGIVLSLCCLLPPSCEKQYEDTADSTINCNRTTERWAESHLNTNERLFSYIKVPDVTQINPDNTPVMMCAEEWDNWHNICSVFWFTAYSDQKQHCVKNKCKGLR